MATTRTKRVKQEQHRQGDLLFVRQTGGLPEDTPLMARETGVILEGEVTGHAHRLVVGAVLDDSHGGVWLDVPQQTQVVHEEHRAITLDPGVWVVIRQREYVAPDISRRVVD